MRIACNLSFIVKNEGVLKVTGSYVYFNSGSISKTTLNEDVVTTGHNRKWYMAHLKAAIVMTLGVLSSKLFVNCNPF